ncbi:MAG: T9SS type A sorting domain-containing protein [Ignavibacteriales bacterium]|nr:T9SS type A sorting domain-containing protein [Ignavibacteriales bacterium]
MIFFSIIRRYYGLALLILPHVLFSQAATHVVISEVSPMNGNSTTFNSGEFIELYNPLPFDVMFGSTHQIISGNTTGTNNAEWQLSLDGATIKAYGFLLVGDGGVTGRDIPFPTSKNLANSGSRSCVQLREGSAVIDAFGWDPVTQPLLQPEGTRFSPSSTLSDGKSFERKSSSTASSPDTLGNAWDTDNNATDFFENTVANANPQNSSSPIEVHPFSFVPTGSGLAAVSPSLWKFDASTTLRFVLKADTDTLRAFRVTVPAIMQWSSGDIVTEPAEVQIASDADTVEVSGFTVAGNDSVVMSFMNVVADDTTDEFTFNVQASEDGTTFLAVENQPKTLVYGSPRSIAAVKQKTEGGVHTLLGKWAVTRGIVTVANEFGGPSYLQDETAGMALFDSSVSNNIERGDEIVILGLVAPFNELFEFAPCILLEKLSEANAVDTLVLTAAQITGQTASEPYEAKLIRINNVTVNTTSWTVTGSGTNYNLTDATGTVQTRISPRVNFAGQPAPTGAFDMVGVLGQFLANYQILPRFYDDIIVSGAGPRILSVGPYEKDITPTQVTLSWTTNTPGTSIVNYGTTPSYGSQVVDTTKVTGHEITITGLSSATIYHFQIGSADEAGTSYSADHVFSTSSQNSTGAINVYFNKSIDASVAVAETAKGNVNLVSTLVERINAARYSIDVCLYSLSGTAGATVATALVNAKDRGVKVRVIGEKDNQGTVPWSTLKNNGITVIDDGYDAVNAGAGLMHNKFLVFDYRGGVEDSIWAWTGSWNVTDPGSNNDMQNAIEIQDKAVAGAFTVEFQEMWGSSTDTPNASVSRFGARKTDNTPHRFVVGGVPIELSFSPSDRTTSKIIRTVEGAEHSVNVAMLTFTRSDIANALKARHDAGVKVRGLLDNSSDTGSQFNFLVNNGLDFLIDVNSAFLHHKYAVVDAEAGRSLPNHAITGSHNWSSAAENSNNENTLIIESNRIANLYLQEFKARYLESGGQGSIVVTVGADGSNVPDRFSLSQNYPNPFNPTTTLLFTLHTSLFTTLKVYDLLGREVVTLVETDLKAGEHVLRWDGRDRVGKQVSTGVYYYRLTAGDLVQTRKMILVR